MLVLSRRIGEELLIAENIRVKVVAVKGNRICLAVTAPPSVRVVRRELLAECCEFSGTGVAANAAAAGSSGCIPPADLSSADGKPVCESVSA